MPLHSAANRMVSPDTATISAWFQCELKAQLAMMDSKLDRICAMEASLHSLSTEVHVLLERSQAQPESHRTAPISPMRLGSPSRSQYNTAISNTSGKSSQETLAVSNTIAPDVLDTYRRHCSVSSITESGSSRLGFATQKGASPMRTPTYCKSGTKLSHLSQLTDILARSEVLRGHKYHNTFVGKVWHFLEAPEQSVAASRYIKTMAAFTMVTVLVTFAQTMEEPCLSGAHAAVVETAIDVVFFVEVAVRYAVSPRTKAFLANTFNLLDVFASVVPLALRAAVGFVLAEKDDLILTTILLSVVPVFRLLKVLRHFEQCHLLLRAFTLSFEALPVLLFIVVLITMSFASIIYFVEPRSNIPSLSSALYFTIVTMTTVGYGDIAPKSAIGQVVVAFLVVSSMLYMAVPLGIVGNAFSSVWEDRDRLILMQRVRDRFVQGGYVVSEIPELFNLFDVDRSGDLNLNDFRRMIRAMRIGLDEQRTLHLFNKLDINASGTISDEEFVKILFPSAFEQLFNRSSSASFDGYA